MCALVSGQFGQCVCAVVIVASAGSEPWVCLGQCVCRGCVLLVLERLELLLELRTLLDDKFFKKLLVGAQLLLHRRLRVGVLLLRLLL